MLIYCDTTVDSRLADPAVPTTGQIWYNSTDNVYRYYNGSITIDLTTSTGIPILPDTPIAPTAGDVWYSEDDLGIQMYDGTCTRTITSGVTRQDIPLGTEIFVGTGEAMFSSDGRGGMIIDGEIILCDGEIVTVQ